MNLDRQGMTLAFTDTAGRGLEIGPSYNPIAAKGDGYRVEIVDHAPAEELRLKYQGYGLSQELLDRIEEVDHIWSGGSLTKVVEGKFDFIIASHFLEHTVDMIGFLSDCESLLNPGGTLALVLPDKRYCFDLIQPLTTVGQVIDAHIQPTRFHSPGTVLDHFAYALTREPVGIAWYPGAPGRLSVQFPSLSSAGTAFQTALAQEEYFDVHHWRFTPSSFSLLVRDLRELGFTRFVEVGGFPTHGYEFFSSLRVTSPPEQECDRDVLLAEIQSELLQSDVVKDLTAWSDAKGEVRGG